MAAAAPSCNTTWATLGPPRHKAQAVAIEAKKEDFIRVFNKQAARAAGAMGSRLGCEAARGTQEGKRIGRCEPQPGRGAASTVRAADPIKASRAVRPALEVRVRVVALRCAMGLHWHPRWR